MKPLTGPEVTEIIRKAVTKAGGPEKLASKLNPPVTADYVRYCVRGGKPGKRLLKLVGVQEVRNTYERVIP